MKVLRRPIIAFPILLLALALSGVTWYRWFQSAETRLHFDRAEQFVRQAKGPEAEAEWLAVLKRDPRNREAQELLAEYYFSRKDWSKGAAAYQRLYALAPNLPHLLCQEAACQLRMDDQRDALDTAKQELTHAPNCVAALGIVTSLMMQQPDANEKEKLGYIRKLAKLQPDDDDIQRMYAEALTNAYLYDEVRPVIAHLLQKLPEDVELYNLRGLTNLASPDRMQGARDALQDFGKSMIIAQKHHQGNSGACLGAGRAYLALHQPEKAIAPLEAARQRFSQDPRLLQNLVAAYQGAHQTEKANSYRKQLDTLVEQQRQVRILKVRCINSPQNESYPEQLVQLLLQIKQPDQAYFYAHETLKTHPDNDRLRALEAAAGKQLAQMPTAH